MSLFLVYRQPQTKYVNVLHVVACIVEADTEKEAKKIASPEVLKPDRDYKGVKVMPLDEMIKQRSTFYI